MPKTCLIENSQSVFSLKNVRFFSPFTTNTKSSTRPSIYTVIQKRKINSSVKEKIQRKLLEFSITQATAKMTKSLADSTSKSVILFYHKIILMQNNIGSKH